MPNAQELEAVQDAVEQPSNGEAASTGNKGQGRQPVDLTKLDEFKEWQRAADRRDAQYQRQLQEQNNKLQALESSYHQSNLRGMDETQQLAYRAQWLEGQLANERQQRELDRYAIQKDNDMDNIARKTGVSKNELAEFPNAFEAWNYAVEKMLERDTQPKGRGRKAAAQDEAEEPDPVDIGTGNSQGVAGSMQAKYNAAFASGNFKEIFAVEEEANKKGVSLKAPPRKY